ncbi:MAG: diguanylate cyclase, partial [Gammaproteobacteria bacterium]|nr:diguanylate cyclase [Gammaproteobacteria bacterium]
MSKLHKIVPHFTNSAGPVRAERHHLIRSLFDEYIEMYAARDDRLTAHFSDNFSGYAGSSDVLVTDKSEWIRITRQDFAQIPGRIEIEMLDLSLQDLAENIVAVSAFFHIHLPSPEDILSQETARLVLIFRLEKSAWKIVHSGISIPYGLAQDGEVYPMSRLQQRNLELEQIIKVRTQELSEANRLLQIQSNTDGLTNISNRRHFDTLLNQEWNRGQRSGTPLAVIMLDIDHFKSFNDHYGHLAGDNCLQRIASELSQLARRGGELAARYGGEEFVIILPDTDKQTAFNVAKQIQKMIV